MSVLDCLGKSIESSRRTVGHLFDPHCTCQALQSMHDYAAHNHWVYSFPVLWHGYILSMIMVTFSVSFNDIVYTVEPPITDSPTSGQPLYNGHWLWHQMKLLQN